MTKQRPAHYLSPLLTQATDVTAVRGEGAYLYDDNDRAYLDFTAGIGVTSTGHCHPQVVAAAREQLGQLIHGQYALVKHPTLLALAERLDGLTPEPLNRFFFSNAGTEAVETAIRLARQATAKPNTIAFRGAFQGRTMGALSLTSSNSKVRHGVQPMMAGSVIAPFPDTYWYGMDEWRTTEQCLRELDLILRTISTPDETAAMIIEPVQGESGFVPANTMFMQGLQARCHEHGIVLIMDEVQAGNGRTGKFWGHEHFGATPDILLTAKGVASGLPLSILAASDELMARGWPGSQGGTYGGNAVSCSAALATLDVIAAEDLVGNAARCGRHLMTRLQAFAESEAVIDDVRGLGLMVGVYIVDADGQPDGARAERIVKACEQRGLLLMRAGAYGGEVVRWAPPLVVDTRQIDTAVDVFTDAIAATRCA